MTLPGAVDPSSSVLAPASPTTATGAGTVPASATQMLTDTLTQWGLQDLIPYVSQYVTEGYDSTTINLALQNTPEWKTRFAGNELRKQNGLPVLSPAQYIATEEQYYNTLKQYGLPAGFYDSHTDFTNWIGSDVSPTEVASRAQIAHDQYMNAPAATKALWQSYGFSQGDAIASILDPTVSTQVIQDRAQQVAIGGAAAANGFNLTQSRAQQFQQYGVTLAQAQNAYQKIAASLPTDQNIAQRFGTQFGQTQEENAQLLGNGQDTLLQNQLYSEENALFKGHSGFTGTSLGVAQTH